MLWNRQNVCWRRRESRMSTLNCSTTSWVQTGFRSRTVSLIWWIITSIIKSETWWRHQMETFSALLAIYAGNSPVSGDFPAQRPVTRSFDIFFDLRLNKRLSKQWWGWWFETLSHPLWRHCNGWNYSFPNFNGCSVEVWEWIDNFIPHITGHVITWQGC